MKKLVFVLCLLLATSAFAQDLVVVDDTGSALVVTASNALIPLKDKKVVKEGETVMVAGRGSVTLATPDGVVTITADEKSLLKNDGVAPDGKLMLQVPKGLVEFQVVPGNKLDVVTPHMVASVRGTRFTTDVAAGNTDLDVTEGAVECTGNDGVSEMVQAGFHVRTNTRGFSAQVEPSRDRARERSMAKEHAPNENASDNAGRGNNNSGGNSGGNSGKGNNAGGKGKGKDK